MPESKRAIRVVVADDHPVITEGLRRFFTPSDGVEIVATVSTIDALRVALDIEARVDVIVLDVEIPGLDGIETVRDLRARCPRIVLFTHQEPNDYVTRLVQAGATGYVSKSAPVTDLLDAILTVVDGGTWLSDALRRNLAGVDPHPLHEQLTPRERVVFLALARGRTAKEIGFELDLAASTVYAHIERVRQKLGVDTLYDLRLYAQRWGIGQ